MAAEPLQIVLVAGYDFEQHGVNFALFCDHRLKKMLTRHPSSDLVSTTLDFGTGVVTTETYSKGVLKDTKKDSSHRKIEANDYVAVQIGSRRGIRLDRNCTDRLSIIDVYDKVRDIGTTSAGSLVEIAFFSHAFQGGPILVNSEPGDRAFDLDPRPGDLAIYSDEDLKLMQSAFAPNGRWWSFGCFSAKDTLHPIMSKLENHADYKSVGVSDDREFVLKYLPSTARDWLKALHEKGGMTISGVNLHVSFGFIRKLMWKVAQSSYQRAIANATRRNFIASFPATAASYESGTFGQMKIFEIYRKRIEFCQSYLGMNVDDEGRGYGVYEPDQKMPQ